MTGELGHRVQGHWDHLRVHVSIYKACSLWTVLVVMLVDALLSALLQLASGPQALLPPDSNQFLSALAPTAFQQQHTALHRSCSACLTDTATWPASQEASRSPYQLPQSQQLTHKEKTRRRQEWRRKGKGRRSMSNGRRKGSRSRSETGAFRWGCTDFHVFTLFTSKPPKSRSPASFLERSYHSEYFQTVTSPYIITL